MYDTFFSILEWMSDYFEFVYIAFIFLQIFLSSRKRIAWGFILPACTLGVMLFLMYAPMPSYRQDTPYMAGMMGLFVWLPLTALLLIALLICRKWKHRKSKKGA